MTNMIRKVSEFWVKFLAAVKTKSATILATSVSLAVTCCSSILSLPVGNGVVLYPADYIFDGADNGALII